MYPAIALHRFPKDDPSKISYREQSETPRDADFFVHRSVHREAIDQSS